eukprot:scaffold499229_cov34-Prasinocladus_malaysianus.AAC.1
MYKLNTPSAVPHGNILLSTRRCEAHVIKRLPESPGHDSELALRIRAGTTIDCNVGHKIQA